MQACPERSVCDAAYTVYAEGHLVTAIEHAGEWICIGFVILGFCLVISALITAHAGSRFQKEIAFRVKAPETRPHV